MQLEEQFYESSTARWKRELPWLRQFRGFRMAMDFRKLLLALLGTLTFAAGMVIVTVLPWSPHASENALAVDAAPERGVDIPLPYEDHQIASMPWESTFPGAPSSRMALPLTHILYEPWEVVRPVLHQAKNLLSPWRIVVEPAQSMLFALSWQSLAWAWTKLLLALSVWAVFGGAISRITALELAGEGAPSLRESLSHSLRFFLSSMGAILLPVFGIGLFWGIAFVIGTMGLIPGIGTFLAGAFWFISLLCGAVLALILIGVAASWPLMYVTISVEGSDAFDAMSRAYSYVFGRPWYALWIATVALVYGAIVLLFLHGAMYFARDLANHATIVGMGRAANDDLWDMPRDVDGADGQSEQVVALGGQLRAAWYKGFMSLSTVFVYSYFWVAMTIAYFLLRHAEDATPFRKVYWPVVDEAAGRAPALSGVAAAEYRERQANVGAAGEVPAVSTPDGGSAV